MPYDFAPEAIAHELKYHSLQQVLFNLSPGDWKAGERGIAALPGREIEFRDSVETALHYATALGCPRVHAMAGLAPEDVPPETLRTVYLDNLHHAARRFAEYGIELLIEPINTGDMPGYVLNHQAEGRAILAELNEPNVKVQMDFYHAQIMDGDIWTTYQRHHADVGHIQIASVPERHEPDTGEVNYPWIFAQLDAEGFDGWVGCEYKPRAGTQAGLGWLEAWKRQ
ncbi:2-oxo-tetronate isomerase [Modicisalibacter radicis]|uniref:2-oxo-tetronate isomerase n=1 Tax=Halomonas sp. EAR18 TaxID=2518972 RepID=UPI0032AEA579